MRLQEIIMSIGNGYMACEQFTFSFHQGSSDEQHIGSGETHLLSTEVAGDFTGVIVAMYAYAPSEDSTPALFDWFDYEPQDESIR